MTTKEWKKTSSAGKMAIRATHKKLTKIDSSLTSYHAVPKHDLEARIRSLSNLMHTIEGYGEIKRGSNPQLSVKQKRKIVASEALYVQAEAKREYLASVKGVERNLRGLFGVGNATRPLAPGPGRFKALAEMVYGAVKYTGGPSDGRMLHESYWTEAIDPLHRNWHHPSNNPVFKRWSKLRYEDKSTTLSFYRWFETLTDDELKQLTPFGLLSTQYQDEAGREQYRVYIDGGRMKQPGNNDMLEPFSTEGYHTNFAGKGWSIFVISKDRKLYANNHDDLAGWFHAAFMGGKPVIAAGELFVRDGRLYGMTPKSGHYKPTADDIINGLNTLYGAGLNLDTAQAMAFRFKNGKGVIAKGGGTLCEWYDANQYRNSGGNQGFLRTEGIQKSDRLVWNPLTKKPQIINGDEWMNKDKFRGWVHPEN